jgi:uncharacterized membrane protein YeaQ/YmgE (transglycosylase-associated protein family)
MGLRPPTAAGTFPAHETCGKTLGAFISLILYLIFVFFTGLIVGGLGRLVLPGRDPMTIPQTAAIGIAGSLIAGLISLAIFHGRSGGGIVLSVICAAVLVWVVRRMRERNRGALRR